MSTPEGIKKVWRNLDWKSQEEKLAFFNHYFKNSDIVRDLVKHNIGDFKETVVDFIKEGKIKQGDKERPITIQDITNKIKEVI